MRTHTALVLLAVVLSGCGPSWHPDTANWFACPVKDFDAAQVEDASTCPLLQAAVTDARTITVSAGVLPLAQWNQLTAPVTLYIPHSTNFTVAGYGLVGGWTDCDLNFIEIGDTRTNLLHEVFHLVDCAEDRRYTTKNHPDWTTRGYFGLAGVYAMSTHVNPSPTTVDGCKVSRPTAEQHANLIAAGFDMATYDAAADAADAVNCKGK